MLAWLIFVAEEGNLHSCTELPLQRNHLPICQFNDVRGRWDPPTHTSTSHLTSTKAITIHEGLAWLLCSLWLLVLEAVHCHCHCQWLSLPEVTSPSLYFTSLLFRLPFCFALSFSLLFQLQLSLPPVILKFFLVKNNLLLSLSLIFYI